MGFIRAENPHEHTQYLLERALPLLLHELSGWQPDRSTEAPPDPGTEIDPDTWNPNLNQPHSSGINVMSAGAFITNKMPDTDFPTLMEGVLIQIQLTSSPSSDRAQIVACPSAIYYRIVRTGATAQMEWQHLINMAQYLYFQNLRSESLAIGTQGGSYIKRLLSKEFTIDPPLLVSGWPQHPGIELLIPGAEIKDLVYVAPLGPDIIYNGIWPLEFRGVVTATNKVTIYPLNNWVGGNLDLAPFQIRILVLGITDLPH